MAVMEVTLATTYQQQEFINRWNYVGSGVPASVSLSYALIYALGAVPTAGVYPATGMMKRISEVVVTGTTFLDITVKDVYSNTDFYSTTFVTALNGARTGEGMPPFNALGFYTNRVRADIRRATKRFGGVSENDVASGGGLQAGMATPMSVLATAMGAVLTYDDEGNTLTFAPCVVSKEEYDPNPDNPAAKNHRAYRYYPTVTEQMSHVAQGIAWDYYSTVRSQTSRQYGKGR